MSRSPQTLRVVLFAISALEGVAGLVLIFATGWVLMLSGSGLSSFDPYLLKGIGLVALAFGYLLCVAARQPARYVAVIDMLIFVAFAAAILNVYGLVALGIGAYFPASYLIARTIVQVVIGFVLFVLRPRGTAAMVSTA